MVTARRGCIDDIIIRRKRLLLSVRDFEDQSRILKIIRADIS